MSGKGRGQHRKNCLLAFIEDCLNDSSMNHLIRWSDKSKEIFQVLWVHAGRSNYYRKTQGCLFDLYREYRGRGMTSDPKQAFRMALKKSPCIKAVSSPNVQEDWRSFQIVLKCHQHSSGSSECVSSELEKRNLKITKSEKHVQPEENNSKLKFHDSNDVDKRINIVNEQGPHDFSYKKSVDISKINTPDEAYSVLNLQDDYFNSPYQINSHTNNSLSNNKMMLSNIGLDNDTVCCKNPCCRYSTTYNEISDRVNHNFRNKEIMSPFSQRNTSTFCSSNVNDPYSMPLVGNQILDSYYSASVEAQDEFGPLAFNSNTYNWAANAKTSLNQCSWKANIAQPRDYSPFQATLERDYDNQALNVTKCGQPLESALITSSFNPSTDLSQKNSCLLDYDYISQDIEQDTDFYGKSISQPYQYQQQMVTCNWM